MFHVKHSLVFDIFIKIMYYLFGATHMIELGQNRKIAALRSSMCVHFFWRNNMHEYMNLAVAEAKNAYIEGNVPVGAVIVCDDKVIASCHNTKNTTNIAINHAEMLCIMEACKYLNSWYLSNCDLYVTLRPCDMCLNALAESRIRNVYFLLDSNYGDNLSKNRENIQLNKVDDYYEYTNMLNEFFVGRRK